MFSWKKTLFALTLFLFFFFFFVFLSSIHQNFLRHQNNKTNYNLVCETLQFLDCICGSTTGGLGLLGLYINERNVALVNQTLESLTEYCQGPCHENQVGLKNFWMQKAMSECWCLGAYHKPFSVPDNINSLVAAVTRLNTLQAFIRPEWPFKSELKTDSSCTTSSCSRVCSPFGESFMSYVAVSMA